MSDQLNRIEKKIDKLSEHIEELANVVAMIGIALKDDIYDNLEDMMDSSYENTDEFKELTQLDQQRSDDMIKKSFMYCPKCNEITEIDVVKLSNKKPSYCVNCGNAIKYGDLDELTRGLVDLQYEDYLDFQEQEQEQEQETECKEIDFKKFKEEKKKKNKNNSKTKNKK